MYTHARTHTHTHTHTHTQVGPLQFLVLDEADRLMDLGFEQDIQKICDYVKAKRDDFLRARLQTVLVSATLDAKVCFVSSARCGSLVLISSAGSPRISHPR